MRADVACERRECGDVAAGCCYLPEGVANRGRRNVPTEVGRLTRWHLEMTVPSTGGESEAVQAAHRGCADWDRSFSTRSSVCSGYAPVGQGPGPGFMEVGWASRFPRRYRGAGAGCPRLRWRSCQISTFFGRILLPDKAVPRISRGDRSSSASAPGSHCRRSACR